MEPTKRSRDGSTKRGVVMNSEHFHTMCRKRREYDRMEKAQNEVIAECERLRESYRRRKSE